MQECFHVRRGIELAICVRWVFLLQVTSCSCWIISSVVVLIDVMGFHTLHGRRILRVDVWFLSHSGKVISLGLFAQCVVPLTNVHWYYCCSLYYETVSSSTNVSFLCNCCLMNWIDVVGRGRVWRECLTVLPPLLWFRWTCPCLVSFWDCCTCPRLFRISSVVLTTTWPRPYCSC